MTVPLAIALAIIGLVLAIGGFIVWRHDNDVWLTAGIGVPGAALIYAGADFLVRILL